MDVVKIEIDINAHIENLKCDIVKQNDEAYAVLEFDNLGFGNILLSSSMRVVSTHLGMLLWLMGRISFS